MTYLPNSVNFVDSWKNGHILDNPAFSLHERRLNVSTQLLKMKRLLLVIYASLQRLSSNRIKCSHLNCRLEFCSWADVVPTASHAPCWIGTDTCKVSGSPQIESRLNKVCFPGEWYGCYVKRVMTSHYRTLMSSVVYIYCSDYRLRFQTVVRKLGLEHGNFWSWQKVTLEWKKII
jgi:hypothetical protein